MALNTYKNFCCYDFETTGINPNGCQLTQIAAVVLDGKTLKLKPGGVFNIEVRPEFDDDKAKAAGFDPVEPKALEVTKKTREALEKAVAPKVAWGQFVDFVNKFNTKGSPYYAPIPVGFNIVNYDLPILQRYCKIYGQVDGSGRQKLFHQIYKVDLMDMMFHWFEDSDLQKINLDHLRDFFKFPQKSKDNAHDALYDVIDCANIFIRFMKFHRGHSMGSKFEGAFADYDFPLKYEDFE